MLIEILPMLFFVCRFGVKLSFDCHQHTTAAVEKVLVIIARDWLIPG